MDNNVELINKLSDIELILSVFSTNLHTKNVDSLKKEYDSILSTLRRSLHIDKIKKYKIISLWNWRNNEKIKSEVDNRNFLVVDDYEISKSQTTTKKNVIWIVNKEGEGTDIDLEKLFDQEM